MIERVMLDIETFGQGPGSVIVSVGAVKFGGGRILDEFCRRIDPASAVAAGLTMDVATVQWWLRQSDAARAEVSGAGGEELWTVLEKFGWWISADAEVWGNGSDFDNVLLAAAYRAVGMQEPWRWSKNRCYRTVKSLYPEVEMMREGLHHQALDDARDQAYHLMAMLGI